MFAMLYYFPTYNTACYSIFDFVVVHVASNRSNPFCQFDDGSVTIESERINVKPKSVEGSRSLSTCSFRLNKIYL